MDISGDESFGIRRHGRRSLQHLEAVLDKDSPADRDKYRSKTFRRKSALNVEKSLQLLDDSVASPTTRGLRTPGSKLNYSSSDYPVTVSAGKSKLDISWQHRPTPKNTPQGSRSGKRLGFMGGQFDDSAHSSFNASKMDTLTEVESPIEVSTTNVGLLLEEDPGLSASRGVFTDFLECLRTNGSQGDIFQLLQEYETTCNDQVTMLRTLVGTATKQEGKYQKTCQVLHLLDQEEATWKLAKNLFKDRFESSHKDEIMMETDMMTHNFVQGVYQSDKKLILSLFERDSTIREGQIVVDWLESCAQVDCERYAEKIKFFSDRAVGYENSLHRLHNQQPGQLERPLVTELDPDAALRQNKHLDDMDKEDEDRLLKYIFVCLRAGQLEKAQRVCIDCGQALRAATLEGWKLYHNPNYDGLGPECQTTPIEGNPYRDVWKTVCWCMTQDPRRNIYEKAVYAVLSGNLRCVVPVCNTWMDYLWAYFRVMVDTKVESEIHQKTTLDRPLDPLPGEYWEKSFQPKMIFKEIEAIETVRGEANTWYHMVQKYLILDDIPALMRVMNDWVKGQGAQLPTHFLRFMTHLVLFLRATQTNVQEDLANVIIEAYVEELIKQKHHQLVAFYVCKLPSEAQVHWYAKFLEGINNTEERQQYLNLAETAGLDLPRITKRVVENIRSRSEIDFKSLEDQAQDSVDTNVSEEDRKKIEAIDWLVFDVSHRAEAVRQANAVMRSFVAMKKLVAAREVFEKLPPDSVDVIHRTWHLQTGTTELLCKDRNAIREYLCMKAHLDAMDSFTDWFNHYHNGKPSTPTPPASSSFTDKVAYEHRVKQYEQQKERWHHNLIMQTQTTKDHIYNVLLFADGGWMVDQTTEEVEEIDDEENEDGAERYRQEQMMRLRSLVLPGLMFLLHNVLHTSEQYTECLQLADILTSEQQKLYEVFGKQELQRFLRVLRDSSLQLLDQGRDPLGYELV